MSSFYERYQQGLYQEVYDEILEQQKQGFDENTYGDASLVANAIMKRVNYNIKVLVSNLKSIGYQFVDGFWDEELLRTYPAEEQKIKNAQKYRIWNDPLAETNQLLKTLEQQLGVFPLSLKCWYEVVGSVNFVGRFPATAKHGELTSQLDPLLIQPLDGMEAYLNAFPPEQNGNIGVPLSPDGALKYGQSGGGPYVIAFPCLAFDAPLSLQHASPMFINYLRTCFQWGGFFGLALTKEMVLTSDELAFVTKDLLRF